MLRLTALALLLSAMARHQLSGQSPGGALQRVESGACGALVTACALAGGWPERLDIAQVYAPHIRSPWPILESLDLPRQEEQSENTQVRIPPVVLGGIIGAAAGVGLGFVLQNNGAKCGDSDACVLIGGVLGMAFGVVVGLVVPSA